ncbi:protein mesh isoform X2 [Vespula squamosa]|uniref:Protein mesh isoform X2 n=1 Tax=Vespula squamosa TaxID=30214 RepID=A0ABD2AXQ7_VESSQ
MQKKRPLYNQEISIPHAFTDYQYRTVRKSYSQTIPSGMEVSTKVVANFLLSSILFFLFNFFISGLFVKLNFYLKLGSRQAGITTGIVLASIIPVILVIICVASRALKKRKEEREQDESFGRTRNLELQRLRKIDEDDDSSTYPSKATEIN